MLLNLNHVPRKLLTRPIELVCVPDRNFFGYILNIFNRPSSSRIKEVGPDRACAEWLLRNGAAIRWKGSDDYIRDYNCLPLTEESARGGIFLIEDVDATDSAISSQGFRHFDGCNYVKKILLCRNHYVNDSALHHLNLLSKSLNYLGIKSCADITDNGLRSITKLSNLRTLHLEDLQGVKNPDKITSELKAALPDCNVTYQKEPSPQEEDSTTI